MATDIMTVSRPQQGFLIILRFLIITITNITNAD